MAEPTFADPLQVALEARLTAFELAWHQGEAELAEFLPPPDDPSYLPSLRELVRRDMQQRWRNGRPLRLDTYRNQYPTLFEQAEVLRDLAFEEYRQRAQAGEPVLASEYQERFGVDVSHWPGPRALTPAEPDSGLGELVKDLGLSQDLPPLDIDATLALRRLARARHRLPHPGDQLLDFILLRELGRGSFARVFLARQSQLADRLVVLKISPNLDDEPWTLAQLQHTHIVPIYSVHQSGPLQIVCMPYFGSLTLAKVIHNPGRSDRLPIDGREFLAPLFERDPASVPISLQRIGQMDYVMAVLWMGARVAEALAHAHDRSIMHCDLKPENILVTDDGQPMLLDFNVSVDSKIPVPLQAARIGGTLPYMAPERLELIRDPNYPVDHRSDLYSLGVILYRLLTGFPPFDSVPGNLLNILDQVRHQRRTSPIPPRRLNPKITPAVDAIVRKLLEPEPELRYRHASDLVEDLERQLSDRPLKHISEPSIRERLSKWRRRHPRLATAAVVTVLVALLVVLPGGIAAGLGGRYLARQRQREAATAVRQHREMIDKARTAIVHLSTRTGDRELLADGLRLGGEVLATYGISNDTDWKSDSFKHLSEEQVAELKRTLGELLLLMARGERLHSGGSPEGVEKALRHNALAAHCFPGNATPAWLHRQRCELTNLKAGTPHLPCNESRPATTELDRYFDALELASQNRHDQALERLIPFTETNPRHFVAWYVRGICHEGTGQLADAVAAFTICISLQPEFPWSYLNRGIVRLKQQQNLLAERDFTAALQRKPGWLLALTNRAIAREAQGLYREAEADATAGLNQPNPPLALFFVRTKLREKLGDIEGARRDKAEGLRRTPNDALGWNTRGIWRLRGGDPHGALADFDQALKLNPRMREALQNRAHVLADHLNQPREAVEALDQLLEFYPDYVEAIAGRGVYLARVGEVERAIQDAADALHADSSPFRLYQMAGLYAQLSRHTEYEDMRAEALRLLAQAFASGFEELSLIDRDPDIHPLKDDAEFKRLVEYARGLLSARKKIPH